MKGEQGTARDYIKEIKKASAQLVKYYRKKVFNLTQKELEDISRVSARTIHDIENSEKANLDYETVDALASAFKLKGQDRESFFRAAGLIMPNPDKVDYQWSKALFSFYKAQELPAFATTPLGDILSINSYALALFNIDPDTHFSILTASPGPTTIGFLFDPIFNAKKLYRSNWRTYAEINVWIFRNLSSSHMYEDRYQQIMTHLKRFDDFLEIWNFMDSYVPPPPPYIVTLHNERFGAVQYTVAETFLPTANTERSMLVFYVPDNEQTATIFAEIRNKVPKMAFNLQHHNGRMFSRIY